MKLHADLTGSFIYDLNKPTREIYEDEAESQGVKVGWLPVFVGHDDRLYTSGREARLSIEQVAKWHERKARKEARLAEEETRRRARAEKRQKWIDKATAVIDAGGTWSDAARAAGVHPGTVRDRLSESYPDYATTRRPLDGSSRGP